jgi:hypothetical protein
MQNVDAETFFCKFHYGPSFSTLPERKFQDAINIRVQPRPTQSKSRRQAFDGENTRRIEC